MDLIEIKKAYFNALYYLNEQYLINELLAGTVYFDVL